jgi:sulfide-dependent adenosine diphosphate thiazole synthase
MEQTISRIIIQSYFHKLESCLSLDVAIVGAGPSGLVAARSLALAGWKVAVFEKKLAPGGGIWGGGMLFNDIVVQADALPLLTEFGISHSPAGDGFFTADAVETASGLIFGARKAGAVILNAISVQDIVFKNDRICGVVILWTPVERLEMHVDPLVVLSQVVLDGTGHPGEIIRLATQKAGVKIDTPTGVVMGERPLWVESGEASTVANTKRLYPGLYASGMAANNAGGGYRMGPIFGGMLKSGQKVAALIDQDLRSTSK